MNKFKFRLTENGFYDGYGTDGTIPMTEEFNLSNLPTSCHYWDGTNWVLDIVSNLVECKDKALNLLTTNYNNAIESGYNYKKTINEVDTEYNFYCSSTTLAKLDVSVRNVERVIAKGDTPTSTQLSYYDRNKKLCEFTDADEFISFMIGYTDHIDAIDKKRVELISLINDAETSEDLQDIDLTF